MASHTDPLRRADRETRAVVREMSPWIERLGRIGFAAKGVIYMLIGVFAARAAYGAGGGATTGSEGVLGWIVQLPFGQFLLVVIAIGLAGYALWRFVQAYMDTENKGSGAKGIAIRAGYLVIALIHVGLAYSAARIAEGNRSAGGGESSAQEWTARLLAQPFGRWLVAIVAAIVIGAALFQFYEAYTGKFVKRLKTGEMSTAEMRWTVRLGRFGFAARGVVFSVMGVFLLLAALRTDPSNARGLGGALEELSQQGYAPWLFGVIALGLVAYGLFQLALARYRRMVIV